MNRPQNKLGWIFLGKKKSWKTMRIIYLAKHFEPFKEALQPALLWDMYGNSSAWGKVRISVVWISQIHISFRESEGFSKLNKSQQHSQELFVYLKLSLDINTASVCSLEIILITSVFWNVFVFKQEFVFSLNLLWYFWGWELDAHKDFTEKQMNVHITE